MISLQTNLGINPSNSFYIFVLDVNFENLSCIFLLGQSLGTQLVIVLGYNLTQYLFIEVNFDKSTIGLYILLISSMLAKFLKN